MFRDRTRGPKGYVRSLSIGAEDDPVRRRARWQRDGVDITGATGGTYTLTQTDVGTTITVVASYTDGEGTSESVTSAGVGPVANVNDAPTGSVTISGTPTEDQTLTASNALADEDGLERQQGQLQKTQLVHGLDSSRDSRCGLRRILQ